MKVILAKQFLLSSLSNAYLCLLKEQDQDLLAKTEYTFYKHVYSPKNKNTFSSIRLDKRMEGRAS